MAQLNSPRLDPIQIAQLLAAAKDDSPGIGPGIASGIDNFIAQRKLGAEAERNALKDKIEQVKADLLARSTAANEEKAGASAKTADAAMIRALQGPQVQEPPSQFAGFDSSGKPVSFIPSRGGPGKLQTPEGTAPTGELFPKIAPKLDEKEVEIANQTRDILAKVNDLRGKDTAQYTGPVQSRLGKVSQTFDVPIPGTGIKPTAERATTYQDINYIKDRVIKLITGAQMSEPEAKRIMLELPDEAKADVDFGAKLGNLRNAIKQSFMDRSRRLESQGIRGAYVPSDAELDALTNQAAKSTGFKIISKR